MASKRWTTSNKAVFNIAFHIIWCPKYRRKVLVDQVKFRLKELLLEKANGIDVTIENMEIMPDHVHLFVKSNPVLAPHYIVQQFKGNGSDSLSLTEYKKGLIFSNFGGEDGNIGQQHIGSDDRCSQATKEMLGDVVSDDITNARQSQLSEYEPV